jgi:hypothetical protein
VATKGRASTTSVRLKRSPSLGIFFASAMAWFLALTLLWLQVSAWTSYPVAGMTHIVLEHGAKDWVRRIDKVPGQLQAETRIEVLIPGSERGRAELIVEVDPAHNAYGLPLFLALLLASRCRHLFRRALAGYFLLLLPQAFSLILDVLKQIVVAGGDPAYLGIASWQLEIIALGFQFGSLLLPTLAPVGLWLWLDQDFLEELLARRGLRKEAGQ